MGENRRQYLCSLASLMGGLWTGCTGSDTCDPAVEVCVDEDTGLRFDGELSVLEVTQGCCVAGEPRCPAGGGWWANVVTQGSAGDVRLSFAEGDDSGAVGWTEDHAVPVVASDPLGYWVDYYLELESQPTSDCSTMADCAARYESGSQTLFACSTDAAADQIEISVRVFDEAGAELECRRWGADVTVGDECGS